MRHVLLASLLLCSAALTGCTSTRTLDRTNPADMTAAATALVGKTADVTLLSGARHRGEIRTLTPSLTAWTEADALRAVPTDSVQSLVIDTRRRSVGRGALLGLGVGAAIAAGAALSLDSGPASSLDDGLANLGTAALIVAAPPVGAIYGAAYGALEGRRTEYVLIRPAAPAGPAE